MKKTILILGLWMLLIPAALVFQSTTTPEKALSKHPVPVNKLTPVDCKLFLDFIPYGTRVCGYLPKDAVSLSNPATHNGATSLDLARQQHTYYCAINVEPDAPSTQFDGATYKFTWKTAAPYMNIKVPKETSALVRISFYEYCNNCNSTSGLQQITHWYREIHVGKATSAVTVPLQYYGAITCI